MLCLSAIATTKPDAQNTRMRRACPVVRTKGVCDACARPTWSSVARPGQAVPKYCTSMSCKIEQVLHVIMPQTGIHRRVRQRAVHAMWRHADRRAVATAAPARACRHKHRHGHTGTRARGHAGTQARRHAGSHTRAHAHLHTPTNVAHTRILARTSHTPCRHGTFCLIVRSC